MAVAADRLVDRLATSRCPLQAAFQPPTLVIFQLTNHAQQQDSLIDITITKLGS